MRIIYGTHPEMNFATRDYVYNKFVYVCVCLLCDVTTFIIRTCTICTHYTTAAAEVVIVIVIIIIFFSLPNHHTAGYMIYDKSATLPILFVPVNNSPPPSPLTSLPSPRRCVYTLYAIIHTNALYNIRVVVLYRNGQDRCRRIGKE